LGTSHNAKHRSDTLVLRTERVGGIVLLAHRSQEPSLVSCLFCTQAFKTRIVCGGGKKASIEKARIRGKSERPPLESTKEEKKRGRTSTFSRGSRYRAKNREKRKGESEPPCLLGGGEEKEKKRGGAAAKSKNVPSEKNKWLRNRKRKKGGAMLHDQEEEFSPLTCPKRFVRRGGKSSREGEGKGQRPEQKKTQKEKEIAYTSAKNKKTVIY